MTGGDEFVDLPRFARQIAVSHRGRGDDSGVSDSFTGVVDPFRGVLGADVPIRDWPVLSLSHLTLDRLAVATLEGSERGRRSPDERSVPSTEDVSVPSGDDPSSTDEGTPEPRVREIIRGEINEGDDRSAADYPPDDSKASGDRSPADDGTATDPTTRREVVRSVETARPRMDDPETGGDRSPADDETATDPTVRTDITRIVEASRSRPDTGRDRSSAGQRAPGPTTRREVVRSVETVRADVDEASRPRPEETSADEDHASVVGSHSTEKTAREKRRSGPEDRSVLDDDPSNFAGTDRYFPNPGSAPTQTTVAERAIRQQETPTLIVSRDVSQVTSTRDVAPGRHPPRAQESLEDRAAAVERPRQEPAVSQARGDPTFDEGDVRMEPSGSVGRTEQSPPIVGSDAETTDAGTRPADVDPPRMVVSRTDGPAGDGADGGDTGLPDGPDDETGEDGRAATRPSRGNVAHGSKGVQNIDDRIDIDRLVDRLTRAFERKARIERERRGR